MIVRDFGLSECGCSVVSKFDREQMSEEQDPKRVVGFAAASVLPGESQEDFDLLRDDLWEHYEPEGPVEEDLVESIVHVLWRKTHLGVFQRAFEARQKWGSYFEYPGDPQGLTRIFKDHRQQMAQMCIKGMTIIAAEIVEIELADKSGEGTKTIQDNAEYVQNMPGASKQDKDDCATGNTEASGNTTIDVIPKGMLKKVVDGALAEIKSDHTKAETATRRESLEDVVGRIANREFVAEIKISSDPRRANGEFQKILDVFNNMMDAVGDALGNSAVQDLMKRIHRDATARSLAEFGMLLTPECHSDELRHKELLDLSIERAHNRLMKYQAARAKKTAADIVSLQPGWAARKR
jgi:hypothetical protein